MLQLQRSCTCINLRKILLQYCVVSNEAGSLHAITMYYMTSIRTIYIIKCPQTDQFSSTVYWPSEVHCKNSVASSPAQCATILHILYQKVPQLLG